MSARCKNRKLQALVPPSWKHQVNNRVLWKWVKGLQQPTEHPNQESHTQNGRKFWGVFAQTCPSPSPTWYDMMWKRYPFQLSSHWMKGKGKMFATFWPVNCPRDSPDPERRWEWRHGLDIRLKAMGGSVGHLGMWKGGLRTPNIWGQESTGKRIQ